MTTVMLLPFKLSSEDRFASADAKEISLENLRDIVVGKDRRYPRSQAMNLFSSSNSPDKQVEFERVLIDEKEDSDLRYQAALHLARLNTKEALKSLIKASNSRDTKTLTGIVKALGRIGDESALIALDKIKTVTSGYVIELVEFSAALIAHRYGLAGHALEIPDQRKNLRLDKERTAAMVLMAADKKELELCLQSTANQTFGIAVDDKRAFKLNCGKRELMVLLNRTFTTEQNATAFAKRKAFPGLVALKMEDSHTYSVAYLVLSSPSRQSEVTDVIITRTNGDVLFSGESKLVANAFDFSLSAVPRPGAYAIKVSGKLDQKGLTLREGLSSLHAQVAKNTPTKLVNR